MKESRCPKAAGHYIQYGKEKEDGREKKLEKSKKVERAKMIKP